MPGDVPKHGIDGYESKNDKAIVSAESTVTGSLIYHTYITGDWQHVSEYSTEA